MTYEPKYNIPSGAKPVKTSPVPVTINGKSIPGYQTTFSDGTSKWIYQGDVGLDSGYDYSTFTGTKGADGKWTWSGTTSNSIPNLSSRAGLTEQQIKDGLYKTPTLQNSLNGIRVQQLGGTEKASKIDKSIPQSSGTSVDPNGSVNQGSQPENTVEDFNKDIGESADTRKSYRKDLSYPIKRSTKQDYIKFEMLEYTPKGVQANVIAAAAAGAGIDQALGTDLFGKRDANRTSIGTVTLPISSPISDTNTVNWGDQSMDTLAAKAGAEALKLIGVGAAPNTQETDSAAAETPTSSTTGKLVGFALANNAVGGNANLFTRATGAISNPNIELLFNGPSLRTFSFTFPMSARSAPEAKVIKEIIRFFKQGMSVKRANTSLFLKSPHTFRIKYIYAGSNKDHPWINMIKECALTNCTVNYTPAGNYATYKDGAMTMYEITLNFSELEPIFDDDYKSLGNKDGNAAGKDTMIGY
jgi:hypothetical protein